MYQALYRVWRPQKFQDVVGQDAIIQTLKNAIYANKVSHAYLFTGPRGTGKTSAAKIFAKAINCPNQVDGEPCNTCAICQAITTGSLGDVIEIDAASNNGVEEIRDIRDKSRYAPTEATYKVYIIDEVHMLSTGAFNALLKTLEEPTQNVIFILATTEPHKIPATIISRAQRFDFKRIHTLDIKNRLDYILKQENITYEERALDLIAKVANGGMRDSLSLLDQVISYGDNQVTYANALQVSGSISTNDLFDYLNSLYQKNVTSALTLLKSILDSGKESSRFVDELVLFARDLLVSQQVDANSHLVSEDFIEQSKQLDKNYIYFVIDELSQMQQTLRLTTQKDIYLDVLTIKLADWQKENVDMTTNQDSLAELRQEIQELKQTLSNLQFGKTSTVERAPARRAVQTKAEFTPNLTKIFNIFVHATAEDKSKITSDWADVLNCLEVSQRAKLNSAVVKAASPDGIVLAFEYDVLCNLTESDQVLQQELSKHFQRISQHPGTIACLLESQYKEVRDRFIQVKNSGQLDQYISQHNIGKIKENQDYIVEEDSSVEEVPEIISQAKALFGEIVEVEE